MKDCEGVEEEDHEVTSRDHDARIAAVAAAGVVAADCLWVNGTRFEYR